MPFNLLIMKTFFILLCSFLLSISFFETASAADMDISPSNSIDNLSTTAPTTTTTGSSQTTNNNHSVKSVKVIDDTHVQILFSEDIDPSSVKVQLVKQSDHSSFRISSYTGVTATPSAVEITLNSNLQEGTSYSITVLSVVGKSGSTISDGALALKDFITPIPLKKSAVPVQNAPSNPNAVMANSGSVTATQSTLPTSPSVTATGTTGKTAETPSELPLTGTNPLFLLLAILPISYFFLRKRV